MTETRALYDVTFERDEHQLPTRLYCSPSTPVAIDSHDLTPCVLCGGIMVICGDLDLCSSCGSRRVRSQAKPAATGIKPCPFCGGTKLRPYPYDEHCREYSVDCWDCELHGPYGPNESAAIALWNSRPAAASRDASLTAFVDDLLDLLQDVGGMSAEWCAEKLAQYETLLREG